MKAQEIFPPSVEAVDDVVSEWGLAAGSPPAESAQQCLGA